MDYKTSEKIKNIGIFAHVDAGKTTLTEQILYLTGKIRKIGSVDSGTAQTDKLSVERERGISVQSAAASVEWKEYDINIIDTPGHIDFAGEAERALTALDGAVLLLSAVEGIQSHTENLWKAFEKLNLPCIVFINKIDRAGADADKVIGELNERFKCAFADLSDREAIIEGLADSSDEIAELYLDGKEVPDRLIDKYLKKAVCERKLVPVMKGSAKLSIGIEAVLDSVVKYLPSADTREIPELSGCVFKIEHTPSGKLAYIRMFGGSFRNRDQFNSDEKITQIRKFNGSKFIDTGVVTAGDIAAVFGIENVRVGDRIGNAPVHTPERTEYQLANPFLTVRVTPQTDEGLPELISAIKELAEEEPLINYRWEKTEREINIDLTGEIQLEIIDSLLRDRYNITAGFSPPSVIFKETPAHTASGYEAYTMPKPCWACVQFKFEPLPRGSGVVYDGGKVPHNQLFYKYQEHIKTSFYTSLEQGLYGWEVTDFKATLTGGEHHTIHTHPLDFFVATPMAFMNTMVNCESILLEPLINFRISAGEEYLGKIIGDITLMRGEFDTPVINSGNFTIETILPVSTSLDYPSRLATLTGGKAKYSSSFNGYRECPLEFGAAAKRRGINPLDRAKWILWARGAITL